MCSTNGKEHRIDLDTPETIPYTGHMTALASFSTLVLTVAISQEGKVKSPGEIYKENLPAVATIVWSIPSDDGMQDVSSGTAFFLTSRRIVTNWHVAANNCARMARCRLEAAGGGAVDISYSRVVWSSPEDDLAVIDLLPRWSTLLTPAEKSTNEAQFSAAPMVPVELAQDIPEIGSPIVVIGSPQGLGGSLSTGILSGRRGDAGQVLQLTAPISPGSSGSPVFDHEGRVIGVITSQITEGQNLNFAIALSALPQEFPDTGEYLGIWSWQNVTPQEEAQSRSIYEKAKSSFEGGLNRLIDMDAKETPAGYPISREDLILLRASIQDGAIDRLAPGSTRPIESYWFRALLALDDGRFQLMRDHATAAMQALDFGSTDASVVKWVAAYTNDVEWLSQASSMLPSDESIKWRLAESLTRMSHLGITTYVSEGAAKSGASNNRLADDRLLKAAQNAVITRLTSSAERSDKILEDLLASNASWQRVDLFWHLRARNAIIRGNARRAGEFLQRWIECNDSIKLQEFTLQKQEKIDSLIQFVIQERGVPAHEVTRHLLQTVNDAAREVDRSHPHSRLNLIAISQQSRHILAGLEATNPPDVDMDHARSLFTQIDRLSK